MQRRPGITGRRIFRIEGAYVTEYYIPSWGYIRQVMSTSSLDIEVSLDVSQVADAFLIFQEILVFTTLSVAPSGLL